MVALTHDKIDTAVTLANLRTAAAGAIATFVGIVRAEQKGSVPLAALEYHAYEEMALDLMKDIRRRAIEKFKLIDAVLIHRLDRVELAETSILVATVSPHRAEAFESCRWIVDAVKIDVPIWKKDIWSDNTTTWVDATLTTAEK